ncbi:hypothetical protein FRX31_032462, partial [Thalictrum thalictroides]
VSAFLVVASGSLTPPSQGHPHCHNDGNARKIDCSHRVIGGVSHCIKHAKA